MSSKELLREGFLDVKFPPDSPERLLHKAWRKLWIQVLVVQPPKREPSLVLNVSRQHSLKVSRDGLRLFRCRSGSRPLQTWALSSGASLIVYLAAESEEETQSWMQTIREGLWPSIHVTASERYEVSLIDDERTFSTGILGLYGRLVKAEGIVSIIHPHWQGTQLRWKQEDIVDISLVRKVGNEDSGVFKITLKSSETRTFYFYCNTASSAIDYLRSMPNSLDSKEHYATKNKIQNTCHENNNYSTSGETSKQLEKAKDANIPSKLLDASLNFVELQKSDDDEDDSAADLYDHVYEEMIPKSSRSPTAYEDVKASAPPPLPEKPKNLRLLKLSESVVEALKKAETRRHFNE